MDVAHLGAAGAVGLPRGLVRALHQAHVGGELLDAIDASDVVTLIEEGQRQDLADAGDGSQAVKRVTVRPLGLPCREFARMQKRRTVRFAARH